MKLLLITIISVFSINSFATDFVISINKAGQVMTTSADECPAGTVRANGQSVDVLSHQRLYSVIGNKYGGDANNFNVPNYENQFLRGAYDGIGRYVGLTESDATKVLINGSSGGNAPEGNSSTGIVAHYPGQFMAGLETGTWGGRYPNRISLRPAMDTTYGAAGETRPMNVAVRYCIHY